MTPAAHAVACPACMHALPPDNWNLSYESYCPACHSPLTAMVFPALLRASGGALAEAVVEGTEATCFYHAKKRAAVPCDQCGRFLCTLCQVELSGQNWCPSCIELHRKQGKLASLDNRRVLYDGIVLLIATFPILMWPVTIVTAPATLYMVVRYWRSPSSLVPRTKIRFIVASLIALAQIVGWAFLIPALLISIRQGAR